MRLAFILYKYFPYGGLQRDMLRIARLCQSKGHDIFIYTLSWEGPKSGGFKFRVLPIKRLSNHARYEAFVKEVKPWLVSDKIDRVIGFNKMPGLDVYYAADPCLRDKLVTERSWITRQLPRYRHFLDYEKAVFAADTKTQTLLIAPRQKEIYQYYYNTPSERLFMMPPGIERDRMASDDAQQIREDLRREFAIQEHEKLVLCIGSGFKTKGLDRSLKALASLPEDIKENTRLFAIGNDNAIPFENLARRLGVYHQLTVLKGRDDIPRFLQGGDLLLHPAYYENSGMVILEAVIAGLPVLTTDICGYAFHVEDAQAGKVVASPFEQKLLNLELAEMLVSQERENWSRNGIHYGQTEDLYSMPEHAAAVILGDLSARVAK